MHTKAPSSPASPCEHREEKIDALRDFIADHLDSARHTGITVIARNPASPVFAALVSASSQLNAAGISVRIILAEPAVPVPRNGDLAAEPADATPGEYRHMTDRRLIEAHEQLRVGAAATWIGDSMRRDPDRRDVFSSFKPDCAATARLVAMAFEALWGRCPPAAGTDVDRSLPSDVADSETVDGPGPH